MRTSLWVFLDANIRGITFPRFPYEVLRHAARKDFVPISYNEFLLTRLHCRSQTRSTVESTKGGISLDLEYVQSGYPLTIHKKRCWHALNE